MTIAETFLADFKMEMANTRRMLECIPDDALEFQPHSKSMTLGRLAGHIAEMARWGADTAEVDELDIQPPTGDGYKPLTAESRASVLEFFDRSVAEATGAIGRVSNDGMSTPWTLKAQGNPIFTMPRINVLKSMVLSHIIHHRAQLSVYLRMNDVAVPGMYGPSADER